MYYRVAIRVDAAPTRQWKSTVLSSLLNKEATHRKGIGGQRLWLLFSSLSVRCP
jgi:hypothetical protein